MSDENKVLFCADAISIEARDFKAKGGIVVVHPDLACLIILTKGGNIILKNDYCLGTEREEYTLPSINIESIEDLPGQIQIFLSSIGVKGGNMSLIHTLSTFPDKYSQLARLYFLNDVQLQGNQPKEYVQTPLQHFEILIAQGKLTDTITIAALQIVKSKLYEITV